MTNLVAGLIVGESTCLGHFDKCLAGIGWPEEAYCWRRWLCGCRSPAFPAIPAPNSTWNPAQPLQRNKALPFFEEVTKSSGIRMIFGNGEEAGHMAILESLGGGIGLIDYDGDGLLDVSFRAAVSSTVKKLLAYPGNSIAMKATGRFGM